MESGTPITWSTYHASKNRGLDFRPSISVTYAIECLRETILLPILDNNNKLQESLNQQSVNIDQQEKIIIDQGRQLSINNDIIIELEAENRPLSTELDDMKVGLNDLEQYGRRNSLRFHNLKMDPSLKECDMTHSMTKFIKKKNLYLTVKRILLTETLKAVIL